MLTATAETSGCQLVITGHTASDRAETLLFHLIRGADLTGSRACGETALGGGITLVRPLLAFNRADTQACCEELGLPVHDSTNSDRQFSRNRLRLDVMPELEGLNPEPRNIWHHSSTIGGAGRPTQRIGGLSPRQSAVNLALGARPPALAAATHRATKRLLHRWVQQSYQQQLSAALTTEIWRQLQARATAAHCLEPWLATELKHPC